MANQRSSAGDQSHILQPNRLSVPRTAQLPAGQVAPFRDRRATSRTPRPRPTAQRDENQEQPPPLFGKYVLVICAAVRRRGLFQHPAVHQLSEPRRQDVPGDPEPPLELPEPPLAAEGVPDDQKRPPVSDRVERPGDRAWFFSKLSVSWFNLAVRARLDNLVDRLQDATTPSVYPVSCKSQPPGPRDSDADHR